MPLVYIALVTDETPTGGVTILAVSLSRSVVEKAVAEYVEEAGEEAWMNPGHNDEKVILEYTKRDFSESLIAFERDLDE